MAIQLASRPLNVGRLSRFDGDTREKTRYSRHFLQARPHIAFDISGGRMINL